MFSFLKKIVSPFAKKIKALFSNPPDDAAFEHLEQILYEADLGAEMAAQLVDQIRGLYKKNGKLTSEEVLAFVKKELLQGLLPYRPPTDRAKPLVILVVGVNGSGKTTSLAKLAAHYLREGKKVLIAAGDTFRAAAIEQLETWAKRLGVDFVKSQPNSDPSGVAFDALAAAKARGIDVVLIDTAGRLQTKTELMHELAKVRRICQKQIPDAPHETLLVVDATIGQNAIDQAKTFHQFTPLTGIILTKLDGTAKGGIAIAIQKQLTIPIQWIGTGEGAEDLERFDPISYVNALFS
ncbi:MAG: signal recognition particle-docking protein FtsY [Verrucomicrobia bacterium]|nr:signal recognition particle-docking protein FtsY [Verrucomicrobiota bacterium]MDE3047055.1 signal recognition particle-docking protein FtsY [Verrucomicrobiota bacterium]